MNIRIYLALVAVATGCAGRAYIDSVVVDFHLVHQYNFVPIIYAISRMY